MTSSNLLSSLGRATMLALLAGAFTLSACDGCDGDNNDTTNNITPVDMGADTDPDPDDDMKDDVDTKPDVDSDPDVDMPDDMNDMDSGTTALLQVLHLADGAGVVDIYVNDELLVDDIDEKQGTQFFSAPAGVALNLDVVAGTDADNTTPVYSVADVNLDADESYIIAALGDVDPPQDDGEGFRLEVIPGARPSTAAGTTIGATVIHAVDDAPAVDVDLSPTLGTLPRVEGIAFGEYLTDGASVDALYVELDPASFYFDNRALVDLYVDDATTEDSDDGDTFLIGFQTSDLATLVGQNVVIAATGSLEEGTFGLTAFLGGVAADGSPTPTMPLTGLSLAPSARLQLVHNSPDPAAAVVDLYVNNRLAFDDVPYQGATPFFSVPASYGDDATSYEFPVDVVASDAADNSDPLISLDTELRGADESISPVTAIVDGVVNDDSLTVSLVGNQRETEDEDGVLVRVHHGSPDTPAVSVRVRGEDDDLFGPLNFGETSEYINLADGTMVQLTIVAADSVAVLETSDVIDFDLVNGMPALVIASGSSGVLTDVFAPGDLPDGIELLVVLPDGTTLELALQAATPL